MASAATLTSHVAPLQSTYLPGEVFKATWEVAYPATSTSDASVTLQDVKISVIGSEIVDPKWVSQAYHANQPAVQTSSRRITRHIFHSRGSISAPSLLLRPGELRRTALSVPLPRVLPPTFSGTSLRFTYHVHVSWTADVQTQDAFSGPASANAAVEASVDPASDAPSERSASQAMSRQCPPAGKAAALASHNATALPSPAVLATVMSAEEIAASTRQSNRVSSYDSSTTALNGKTSPGNGMDRDCASADTQAKHGPIAPTRSWLNLQLPAGALTGRIGLSRTSSSSTALPPAAAIGSRSPAGPSSAAASIEGGAAAAAARRLAMHSARAPFRIGIAPAEALATVAEADSDACASPRLAGLNHSGSSGMATLSGQLPSTVPPAFDAVHGPMIDFPMALPEASPPVATEVLPPLPIGAEHALWGSPQMAMDGHCFLWAPNEADEVPPHASAAHTPGESSVALTPGGGGRGSVGGPLPRDLSIIDSVDGQLSLPESSAADTDALAADASIADSTLADSAIGNFGSGSPVYRRSEAGTPRVGHRGGPASDRGAADPRAFHLAFRGASLARIELHTPHEGPLYPGCTFSVTVDFRSTDGAARRRAGCHQVVVVLETEEQVTREWLPAAAARRATAAPGIRRAYDEAQEATLHSLFCGFMFTVPQGAPAAFRTPLLALRWGLRFEFSVVAPAAASAVAAAAGQWRKGEELVWRMPLPVAPVGGVSSLVLP